MIIGSPARLFAVLLCSAFVGGCDLVTGDDDGELEARRGVIHHYAFAPQIEMPAAAAAGVPFDVVVTTYGGGCVVKGPTQVSVTGPAALVEPIDSVPRPGAVCTDNLVMHAHRATITFAARGSAVVVIRGLREPENRVIEISRTIQIN